MGHIEFVKKGCLGMVTSASAHEETEINNRKVKRREITFTPANEFFLAV
jgi:hypothetical protein